MFCTNCGKKIYDGDRFCAHCGTKVREEAPVPKPVSTDVVFNPPFKVEAERRTSEIYRGFASETAAEEKVRRTEPVSFDWNLDGFPQESRKTEAVNFNWDSVIERRNHQKREEQKLEERYTAPLPVVDKIDIRAMQEQEADVRVRTPLFVETVFEKEVDEPFFVEPPAEEAEPVIAEIPKEPGMEEILTIDDIPDLILPETLSAEAEEQAAEQPEEEPVPAAEPVAPMVELPADEAPMTAEELERELFGENYKGIGSMAPDAELKNTAQLEKFYTYNKKNEEFQQLLDQEYERLQGMEEARRPDTESLEFTWATTLFPEKSNEEPKTAADGSKMEAESAVVPSDTIDFTAVREEARQKKLQEAEAETAAAAGEPETETAAESETVPEAEADEPAAEPEEAEAEVQPEAVCEAETAAESSEPSAAAEGEAEQDAVPCTEEENHDEKAKLRYSDVFPRESVADHSDAGSAGPSLTAAKVSEVFDEEDDEPKKMNFFVKLIITLLVVLILAEGVILLAKFIAPDSAFTQKADVLIESLMDRLTGGDGGSGDGGAGEDGSNPVSGDMPETTYISDLLAEKIELPDTIGEVLEDAGLKYDLEKEYAFEEIPETADFENSDWLTGEDGEPVTYAEGILDAVTGYYGQWQATNRDTSLIGINKLEIGEIRTGEKGYYVLCRLTFAAADGEEKVEYVTACVKISQNSMIVNEIEEEKL